MRPCRLLKSCAVVLVFMLVYTSFSSMVVSDDLLFSSAADESLNDVLLDDIKFYCYNPGGVDKSQEFLKVSQQDLEHMVSVSNEPSLSFPVDDSVDVGYLFDVYGLSGPKDTAWPMQSHDNHHTGRSIYSTLSNNGAELWHFKCSWIEGGPVVDSDGTIYFGEYADSFYALNPDGSLKWRFDDTGDGVAFSSVPALSEDGTIYIGSWDHYLYALNPDGTLKWKIEIGTTASSPAIGVDGTVYTGTMDHKIYALNPDGTERWCYSTGGTIIGGPALGDDGTIYIGSMDTFFYAINPDGTLKWQFDTDDCIKGSPSIADDGTIYIGSYDGYLYALYPDGSLKWKCKIDYGTESNPSMGPDGTIYVGGNALYAVNPDGTLKWVFELGSDEIIFQSYPAVSSEGIVYVGTNIGGTKGGDIIAVNPDGTLRWRHRIANEWVDSSPCIGENGIVYIGSTSIEESEPYTPYGYLYAFGPGDVNNPPNTPSISGTNSGKAGETYTYTISGTDPDNDMISYFVDWGDGSDSGWQGPYDSGTSIELSHSWTEQGSYIIKAKAMDSEGSESNWATRSVSMPKNHHIQFPFLEWLQQHFPIFNWLPR